MIILGLTGSIGMGKSTAAQMLRKMGIPVHDADAVVHQLLSPGGKAVPQINQHFPEVIMDGKVDRAALGQRVFNHSESLKKLESIMHPLVREEEKKFLDQHRASGEDLVVLDIPLLFETGAEQRMDYVAVVTAPAFIQKWRVLRRPGMTREKFEKILMRQWPDALKRKRADFIIPTGWGRAVTWYALSKIVSQLKKGRTYAHRHP